MNPLLRRVRITAGDAYRYFWASETLVMLTMALVVGVGGGFSAVGFRWLIETAHSFFFGTLGSWLRFLGRFYVVILPGLGGLIVGLLIHFVSAESKGPGVASVMEAMALRGGRIRPVVIAVKPLVTSITIGSGGSGGREGPIVQIGSAIGSTLSRLARLSEERTKNLVAAGAAAGIAATFNAPLAGVMFALEVLLAQFELIQFTSVVVSAVIASVIGHAYFGDAPAFAFPQSSSPTVWELPVYGMLGIFAASVGVGFNRSLHWVTALFREWAIPSYVKPALGGLLVGSVGLWFLEIFGVGYGSIEAALFGRLTIPSLLVLGLLKLLATSITIGSGGSGGIFGPSLFLGAMLGAAFGQLVHTGTPEDPFSSAYALVGMSAVFGAVSHAPITAILTLFEMTRDYNAMLPLMLSTVISVVVARRLFGESIYTVQLSRRGIDVRAKKNLNLMSTIPVREAMTPIEDVRMVTLDTSLPELARLFDDTHYHGFVVTDSRDRLKGVVSLDDLEQAQAQQRMDAKVADIYDENVRAAFPDQALDEALRHFGALDVGRIPVVDCRNPDRVVGVLRRGDIVRAYSHAYEHEQARLAHMDRSRLEAQTGQNLVEIRLRPNHRAVGQAIEELNLPSECLVASIRRGGRTLIPRGDSRLEVGDIVVILVPEDAEAAVRARITGRESRHE